jgi:hypothetical protein
MELTNTIVKIGGADGFKSPGAGQHIMGLVSIKNSEKKLFKQEGTQPSIRFTFKCAADPDEMVSINASAKLNPKSSLFKVLKKMSGGKLNEASTAEQAFALMEQLLNKWYDVAVGEKPSTIGEGMFAFVDDNDVRPARAGDCPTELPFEYFKCSDKPAPEKTTTRPTDDDINF